MNLLSQIINGLSVGSIYALVALGYSMVYGIVKLINFAHGDIIMFGSYVVYVSLVTAGLPLWVSIIAAIALSAIAGMLTERLAYRRLLNAGVPRISLLITAIGVSMLLQNLCQLIFSSSAKSMPALFSGEAFVIGGTAGADGVVTGGISVSLVTVITIITTVVMMVLLRLLINKTKIGKAMRAVSEDAGAARLMGINTGRTVSFTFAIGSMLAAVGAVLYVATYRQIGPFMGSMLGLKAFVAAVLGGIGSIPGAMVGGLMMGVVESITKSYASTFSDAVVFGILIIVLMLKPTGLMGKKIDEKV